MTTNDLSDGQGNGPGVALRRAEPLKALPPPTPEALAAARSIARTPTPAPVGKPAATPQRPGIEAKIAAAGYDAQTMLRTLDTEMALRRAGRKIRGDDQVQTMRVLSIAMLFTLLLAALGAMSYVQTQFVGHGFKHRAATAVTASPAPEPSTPDARSARQSAPPTR